MYYYLLKFLNEHFDNELIKTKKYDDVSKIIYLFIFSTTIMQPSAYYSLGTLLGVIVIVK